MSSIKVGVEMQTPSTTTPLDVMPAEPESGSSQMRPGESLQNIVRFDLREEGNHTLAVNLSYSETTISQDQSASSGRFRTFRKLYQFVARPCVGVRTKVSNLPSWNSGDSRSPALRFAVEGQIENLADGTITLEAVAFHPKQAFKSTSLNWDAVRVNVPNISNPILAPRDM